MASPSAKQPPFEESRLKIKRANKHISEFRREVTDFGKRRPYRYIIEENPDPIKGPLEWCIWRRRVYEELPVTLPLIVGDAVHNLRSSLDLLTCEAVRRNRRRVTSEIQFPIASTPDRFEGEIEKRHIEKAGPKFLEIIRTLKPYKGGDLFLWELHKLDIWDKHRLLIITTAYAAELDFRRTQGMIEPFLKFESPMEHGSIFTTMPASDDPHLQIGCEVDAAFKVKFGEGVPFQHQSIAPTLRQLADATLQIVEIFAAKL